MFIYTYLKRSQKKKNRKRHVSLWFLCLIRNMYLHSLCLLSLSLMCCPLLCVSIYTEFVRLCILSLLSQIAFFFFKSVINILFCSFVINESVINISLPLLSCDYNFSGIIKPVINIFVFIEIYLTFSCHYWIRDPCLVVITELMINNSSFYHSQQLNSN